MNEVKNSNGCFPCPICGKYPEVREGENHVCCHLISCTGVDRSHYVEATSVTSLQKAKDAWNQRYSLATCPPPANGVK